MLAGVGGITYNLRIGDLATGWVGDHIEPCVSARNPDNNRNDGANFLACVGNVARVATGDAKGAQGFVTGKHGGCEHILIDLPKQAVRKLAYGDTVVIHTLGQGLELLDFEDIRVMNLDPRLLACDTWPVRAEGGKLVVAVAHTIPARIMGAGLGTDACQTGDYDVQLFDAPTIAEFGLEDLRLGDIVAILDADHSYGRIYRTGAVSIGVVVHGACVTAGHGPGITTLMTSPSGAIQPEVDPKANLAQIIGVGQAPPWAKVAKKRTPSS